MTKPFTPTILSISPCGETTQGVFVPRARVRVDIGRKRWPLELTLDLYPDAAGVLHGVVEVKWVERAWKADHAPAKWENWHPTGWTGGHYEDGPRPAGFIHVWGVDEICHELVAQDPTSTLGLRTGYWEQRISQGREAASKTLETARLERIRVLLPLAQGSCVANPTWYPDVTDHYRVVLQGGQILLEITLSGTGTVEAQRGKVTRTPLAEWRLGHSDGQLRWFTLRSEAARACIRVLAEDGDDLGPMDVETAWDHCRGYPNRYPEAYAKYVEARRQKLADAGFRFAQEAPTAGELLGLSGEDPGPTAGQRLGLT